MVAMLYAAKEAAEFLKGLHQLATIQAFVCGVVFVFGTSPSFNRYSVSECEFLQLFTHQRILQGLQWHPFEPALPVSDVRLPAS